MKALNRAIARTVSQIARHAGEGCHVPMIMALENHLDALLTMERKMLEGVRDVAGPVVMAPAPHANDDAQLVPDVIDMTDPRNWQVGDVVVCNDQSMTAYGKEFVVVGVGGAMLRLEDGEGYELYFVDAGDHFQWLRHGEVQS